MSIIVYMQFPDAMKPELEAKGVPHWSRSGEFKSLKHALEEAGRHAAELNMPIEVKTIGTARTVYPPALDAIGYGGSTRVD